MAEKKSFLLRVDAHLLVLIKGGADDDSRSLNGQIEYVVKKALKDSGRWKEPPDTNKEE
jgi:hypothetical protein